MNKIARNIWVYDDHYEKLKILAIKKKESVSSIIRNLIKTKLINEGIIEQEESVL